MSQISNGLKKLTGNDLTESRDPFIIKKGGDESWLKMLF
jgi:hypothetical protein